MTIGQVVKRLLRVVGVQAYSRKRLPWGISLERDLERLLSGRKQPLVLFDVGANSGQTAVRFRRVSGSAWIYCFEPILSTYQTLRRNVRRDSRTLTHQIALGDRNGREVMEIQEHSQLNRIARQTKESAGRKEAVEMLTVETFCLEHEIATIDLLKTDCEGFDHQVLAGADAMLAEGRIFAVLCEVNLRRDGQHADFFAIHEYLERHRYYVFAFYDYSGWGDRHSMGSFQNVLWLRLLPVQQVSGEPLVAGRSGMQSRIR